MHKVLQDERLDQIQDIQEWYEKVLEELHEKRCALDDEKHDRFFTTERKMATKALGWQAFEESKLPNANPFEKRSNDFRSWQEGWRQTKEEMAIEIEK